MKRSVVGSLMIIGALLAQGSLSVHAEAIEAINVQLGGELEFEYVDTQAGPTTSEEDPHFQVDKFYLYPKVTFPGKDIVFRSEIIIQRGKATVEEASVRFSGLPFNSWFEVGPNDLFIANIDRKSEMEILIETAFYRDDDMGIAFGGNPFGGFYWVTSVSNGFKLTEEPPGEDPQEKGDGNLFIADGASSSHAPQHLMVGLGAGIKQSLGGTSKIDLLPFLYTGKLDNKDVTFLNQIPGYSSSDDSKSRYGFNARYDAGRFTLIGQYLRADDGKLNRRGYFIQPSIAIASQEYVYRYNNLEVGLPQVATSSLTWDRVQQVFAVISNLYKGIKLKTEYIANKEKGAHLPDNEVLVQLEVTF